MTAQSHIQKLYDRQGGLCHWCDKQCNLKGSHAAHNHATVDHVFPKGDERRDTKGQFQTRLRNVMACRQCNGRRGDLPYDVFLLMMRPEWRGVLDAVPA